MNTNIINYYQVIFTIATFALFSFIFSLFMVPVINNLKQIQRNLRNIIKPKSYSIDMDDLKRRRAEETETKEFIKILEEYKLEYKNIDSLKKNLIYGVTVTFVFIILIFLFNNNQITPSLILLLTFLIEIFILIVSAFMSYIPSPYKITDWGYMSEYFNLSPSGIERCANLTVNYNLDRELFKPVAPESKRLIKIYSDIELRGYKYWVFIYDTKNKKIIFNTTKTVTPKNTLHELLPDTEIKRWQIDIAEFDSHKYAENKNLKIFFFVFDPIIYGNTGSPYWGYKHLNFERNITFSSEYQLSLSGGTFPHIKYAGKGLHFLNLIWEEIPIKTEMKDVLDAIKETFDRSIKELKRN